MNQNKKIKVALFILLFVLFVIGVSLASYISYKDHKASSVRKESKILDSDIRKIVLINTKEIPTSMENQLAIFNDLNSSDEEKYTALTVISFYFSSEYSGTHNPSIRLTNEKIIGSSAKKLFPKQYKEGDFEIPCADPKCGQELSSEINEVLKTLASSNLDLMVIDMISNNLTTAGYAPDKPLDDKKTGFSIAYHQMIETGNPQASNAASLLKSFAKNKYSIDL